MKKFISSFIVVILLAMVLGGLSDRCKGPARTEEVDKEAVKETVAEVEENDSDCGIQSQFDLNYESYTSMRIPAIAVHQFR